MYLILTKSCARALIVILLLYMDIICDLKLGFDSKESTLLL